VTKDELLEAIEEDGLQYALMHVTYSDMQAMITENEELRDLINDFVQATLDVCNYLKIDV
jgi:hypothetical protein